MIKVVAKSFIKADKVEQYVSLAKKLVQETVPQIMCSITISDTLR